eukprot:TRINITY_DN14310_c1_g1_i1.p1 TRINITY_DN14310_c1_g1~~TRINITY_DN14310_c1_g1_i1.p1  ORF type:complete len:173 (+),score=21.10 TRINITY_DN14310_c1_g1_i1:213-731(+)
MVSRSQIWKFSSSHTTEGSLSQSTGTSYSDSNGDSGKGSQTSRPPPVPKRRMRKGESAKILEALKMVGEARSSSKTGKARQCEKMFDMFTAQKPAEVGAHLDASNGERPVEEARPSSKTGKMRQCEKMFDMFTAQKPAEVGADLDASKGDRPVLPDLKELSGTIGRKRLISL